MSAWDETMFRPRPLCARHRVLTAGQGMTHSGVVTACYACTEQWYQ